MLVSVWKKGKNGFSYKDREAPTPQNAIETNLIVVSFSTIEHQLFIWFYMRQFSLYSFYYNIHFIQKKNKFQRIRIIYKICEMFIEQANARRSHRTICEVCEIFSRLFCIEISHFISILILCVCSLTHACVCFGGWSGAMLPSGRDSNGIPPVRRTPDGVLASCINGIFDDALSLHNISSRSICTTKKKKKKPEIEPYRSIVYCNLNP